MNILLVPSAYAPNIGGVESVTRGLAQRLHAGGHGVAVVTPRWPATLPDEERIDGIRVVRIDCPLPWLRPDRLIQFAATFPRSARRMRAVAEETQTDVVHVHCLGPNTLYAAWVAQQLRRPLILSTHGELQGDDTGIRGCRVMRWLHCRAFRRAAWVTACSEYTLQNMPYESEAERSVVFNGFTATDSAAATDASEVQSQAPYILCVSRLTHNKGIDVAIRAFAAAARNLSGVDLWLAGDGELRQPLQRLAGTLGIAERIRFLGNVPAATVPKLMADSLFVVCPSRNEGFGLVNLEAMAVGKAVIASHVGGIPELVLDGQTGLLFRPEDVEELSRQIQRLATDPAMRQELGSAGKRRAGTFSWDACVDGYLSVYATVLKQSVDRSIAKRSNATVAPAI